MMPKGQGFPRFRDGNVYIQLSGHPDYHFWVHKNRLDQTTFLLEDLVDYGPCRTDLVACFNLRFDSGKKLWLLKQVVGIICMVMRRLTNYVCRILMLLVLHRSIARILRPTKAPPHITGHIIKTGEL